MSPFEANYGFKPLTPLDVVLPFTPFALSADAEKRVKLLKDTHAYASELLRLAKNREWLILTESRLNLYPEILCISAKRVKNSTTKQQKAMG